MSAVRNHPQHQHRAVQPHRQPPPPAVEGGRRPPPPPAVEGRRTQQQQQPPPPAIAGGTRPQPPPPTVHTQAPRQPPPPAISARDHFDASSRPSSELRRTEVTVSQMLTTDRAHPRITSRDVSRVHDLLGQLSPSDYRKALDGMSRNGELGTYLQAMTPFQRSGFLQQAANKGYLRMEGGRRCEGTANPPREPALYRNDANLPPEVRQAVTSTNQQVATKYSNDVDQYAQRYSQQVEATSDVPGLRELGEPQEPAAMTEPGTGNTLAEPSIEEALKAILTKVLELLEQAAAQMQSGGPQPSPDAGAMQSSQAPSSSSQAPNPDAADPTGQQNLMAMVMCAFVGVSPDQMQEQFDPQSFFRRPPELSGGTQWNQLDSNRQQQLNQNGWTGQEWAGAR